jgi:hypothetical protein
MVHGLRQDVVKVQSSLNTVDQRLGDVDSNMRVVALVLSTVLPSIQWREGHDVEPELTALRPRLVSVLTRAIDQEERWRNPLAPDEIERLKRYRDELDQGHMLTVDEAEDMKQLAERMGADHPNDSTAGAFLLLAGLILALLLSSRKT